MWVFGYGSLLWKTNFPYDHQLGGTVKGYVRRFWQLSPDHRGTSDRPGRTVTLVPDSEGEVWGIAYHIPDEHRESTLEYLNYREKAGYILTSVMFSPDDASAPFHLSVYLSIGDDNPYHTGPVSEHRIAEQVTHSLIQHTHYCQVVDCIGPSGTNIEYVLRLAHVVRTMAPAVIDEHLFAIEALVLQLCKERNIASNVMQYAGCA